jgi:DNA-nicking Smr family endonuclease
LWEEVAKTVKPLSGRPASPPPLPRPSASKRVVPSGTENTTHVSTAEPPRLAPFDRRLKSRIGKGTVVIDARVDLHGLTQEAAHRRLGRFLADCQAAQAKVVLVITGKGRAASEYEIGAGRGVLRRLVPLWLASAELRPYVVGYETAGRSHGGEGALYVRIRGGRGRA